MNNNCVFCDRRKLEDRIIFENKDWRVVVSLGQITDGGYALVIPKEHISCLGALTPDQAESAQKITQKICRAIELEYRPPGSNFCQVMAFEHGIVGQTIPHAHFHLLPTEIDLTAKIRADFPLAKFEELKKFEQLQKFYSERQEPYLFWTRPDNTGMICWNPPAPPQYLRLITAELLGKPERGNWRNMDAALDKKLGLETFLRLKSYF